VGAGDLPGRRRPHRGVKTSDLIRRRWDGTFSIDEWGLDPDLVHLTSPLFTVRWNVSVAGAEHVPAEGPAVVVFNQRLGLSEPMVVPRAIRLATGRHVRVAGVIDVAPIGTVLRRLGGVLADPDEVVGLLRAGQVVGLGLSREPVWGRPGDLDLDLLAPAVDAGVPIVPCAVGGLEVGRRWRLALGPPVSPPGLAASTPDVLDAVRDVISRSRAPRRARRARRPEAPNGTVVELVR